MSIWSKITDGVDAVALRARYEELEQRCRELYEENVKLRTTVTRLTLQGPPIDQEVALLTLHLKLAKERTRSAVASIKRLLEMFPRSWSSPEDQLELRTARAILEVIDE